MLTSRTVLGLAVIAVFATLLKAADGPASPAGAAGKVYVVDQNHPKAGDDNPGTPDAPWKTIAKAAATAQAGETVYVMEGDYKEQVKFAHSGVKDKPIRKCELLIVAAGDGPA